ncbi:MAG: NAD(P)-dependent alcohol dehydrogenase [Acidimicrobiia bacterium]|nr:NAD(P)-dependent alcohol dehydrogenase [Acidimicrobiia bacterium]NNL97870.1 NAD(P)-dependent alcohol dehydrogenase [Acidimicrobiia bacterium]
MKAIVHDEYGSTDVLKPAEIDTPAIKDNELLVRVRAASLNPYDWHLRTGKPLLFRVLFGLRKPKKRGIGADLAGEVKAVGAGVTQFRSGDEVYGEVEAGALAEYVAVSEDAVALKPTNLTFEQAAAVPMGGLTSLQALRDKGGIRPGQTVLINGSSGGVGTFAVQIAKAFGAEATAVCSTKNIELVRSLGADHVVDYTREDFTKGERRYDLMLDNVGNHSATACRRVLAPKGVRVATFGSPENTWLGPLAAMARMALLSLFVGQKMIPFSAKPRRADFETLTEMIEAGKVSPVIDRTHPLAEAAEAMEYLDAGHARGKVVITI